MVFCGKPSRGCTTCRARKIRVSGNLLCCWCGILKECDQLPDGCSQCTKIRKACPGYRDQMDLVFRDESEAVINKAKSREAKASDDRNGLKPPTLSASSKSHYPLGLAIPPPSENFHQLLEQRNRLVAASTPSTFTMTPTLEEMATGFFLSHYVLRVNGPSLGHLEHLIDMYNTPAVDENLMTSMRAVGLAGYSHFAKAPHLIMDARAQYAKALRLTNAALRSQADAKKDSTLLAIMILGIFEVVTGCNERSLDAWSQHVHGAAALLKLRGMEQMNTVVGRSMYIQVSTNLLITCIQRKMPMPADILELRAQVVMFVNTDDIAWRVQEAMIEFADFRSKSRRGAISDPSVILSTAMRLDRDLTDLFLNVPPNWEYQTVFTDADPDIVFEGRYHIYYDFWIAQIWNGMRSVRILLNEQIRVVILEGLSSVPPSFTGSKYTAQLQASTDVLFVLQADILASVPAFLGYVPNVASSPTGSILDRSGLDRSGLGSTSSAGQFQPSHFFTGSHSKAKSAGYVPKNPSNHQHFPASGGYFILWPLFLAGRVVITTPRIQKWVSQCMRHVANSTGIQHALVAADVVEKGEDIRVFEEKPATAPPIETDEDVEPE